MVGAPLQDVRAAEDAAAAVPHLTGCCLPSLLSPAAADLLPLLGPQSLVLTAGEPWRRQREAFNPGFSAAFLRAALPGFLECSARLAACLETAAEEVEVVRMHDLAVQTTLEVICQVRGASPLAPTLQPQQPQP